MITSAQDYLNTINRGFNIGNVLTAFPYEFSFQQPPITKAYIQKIKSLGFNTIRLPVNWTYHCSEDYTINPLWLDRIGNIIKYALDEDMLVVLNSHHDTWEGSTLEEWEHNGILFMSKIWSQIAKTYAFFDNRLSFEMFNEPLYWEQEVPWWLSPDKEEQVGSILNNLYRVFMDAVTPYRKDRVCFLTPYSSNPDYLKLCDFPKSEFIGVNVHFYSPFNLCLDKTPGGEFDDKARFEIDYKLKQLENCNYPLLITETGILSKVDDETFKAWSEYLLPKLPKYCWWDDGGDDSCRIIDRETNEIAKESARFFKYINKENKN